MGYGMAYARRALLVTAALTLAVGGAHTVLADDSVGQEDVDGSQPAETVVLVEDGGETSDARLRPGSNLEPPVPVPEEGLEPVESVGTESAEPERPSLSAPCPGADAPYSATDVSSAADVSASDLLTEEEYENAFLMTLDGNGSVTFGNLLVFAEQYRGLPYVWGGKDPDLQGGFDCSGFVAYVMNKVCGTNIDAWNWNAAMIYSDHCIPVSREEARPGDLVFFTGTYGGADYISHVGLYCGSGIMLDAGDPIGYHYIDQVYKADKVTKAGIYFGRVKGTDITSGSSVALEALGRVRIGDVWYTGSPVEPDPSVVVAGRELVRNIDYAVEYRNNVGVGTATAVIVGIGGYTGSLTTTFDIVDPQGSLSDGVYTVSPVASDLVLDVMGGSTSAGGEIGLFAAHGGDNQAFRIARLSNGYYSIVNVKSGLPLSHATNVANLLDGTIVTQENALDTRARQWMIKPSPNGGYTISSAWDSTMVLAHEEPARNEAIAVMCPSTGATSQSWSLVARGGEKPPVVSGWRTEGGQTYYYVNGVRATGEKSIDGQWYYFDPEQGGAMARGFVELSGAYLNNGPKTVYYDADGRMAHDERMIDGYWYHFDSENGAMARGFLRLTGAYLDGGPKTVYYDENGRMAHDERMIDGHWYHFDPVTGAMARGFLRLNGSYLAQGPKTVYYDSDGRMVYGEQPIGGAWYYFDPDTGAMATGFVTLRGAYLQGGSKTVFYDSLGRMVYGDRMIDGKAYYFDLITGAMSR